MPEFIWAITITLPVCKSPCRALSSHYPNLRFPDPNVDHSLSELLVNADLSKLRTASEATHDSYAEGKLARCLKGTRTQLLLKIMDWTKDAQGKGIFWLRGKAGVGKSTISRTIANELEENGQLGASFFFKRGHVDRSHAKLFFPTIARQLADKFPQLGHAIAAALRSDSGLGESHITKQFDMMLLQPLRSPSLRDTLSKDCFLIVDALDECDDVNEIETLLELLERIGNDMTVKIRILVTSRPDPTPRSMFADISKHLLDDMELEKAQVQSIGADLKTFFIHELGEIRKKHRARWSYSPLLPNWATPSDVDILVEKSHPLFIVAFTLCKIISTSHNPQADLRMLVSQTNGRGPCIGLQAVYLPVLQQAIAKSGMQGIGKNAALFRKIIGSLILLYDPLSATALSNLLDVSMEDVGAFIPPLQSILSVAETLDGTPDPLGTIELFHLSFRDFLLDPNLAKDDEGKQFWIEEPQAHRKLKDHCLRLLGNGALKEDMCCVKAPGTLRASVEKTKVTSHLPREIEYACCYWVQHAVISREMLNDHSVVLQFLEEHMLHWMEAMSWLGKASDINNNIVALRSVIDVSSAPIFTRLATYLLLGDSSTTENGY